MIREYVQGNPTEKKSNIFEMSFSTPVIFVLDNTV